ncbi:hypothetical protein MAPG_06878 [Magnaporthiopsis poae ATCC 64411]|uniref:DUF803 domain membrane protein n=1 Tax=Magnaporthiopsis poae (strain ATCC 64411 / 73-15) TaxID=644358 RepID=A0A0C4E386_MAGP6|nr:hypothetical protein MAPG_06878 [Magnaporthiopsis poae ATCC 64411]
MRLPIISSSTPAMPPPSLPIAPHDLQPPDGRSLLLAAETAARAALAAHTWAAAAAAANSTRPGGSGDGGSDDSGRELQNWSSIIGIVTAIVGNMLIALALNVQRYAHISLHRKRLEVRERARQALRNAAKGGQNGDGARVYGTLGAGLDGGRTQHGENGRDEDESHLPHESNPLAQSIQSTGSSSSRSDDDGDIESTNYLKSPSWWLGQVLITVGEMGNFLAYGFAPASIVSPLGVVALVSNCVIAPIFFKEVFRQRDFLGVVVAVAGAITVVMSANTEETKLAPHDVWKAITTFEFKIYMAVSCSLIALLMWMSPRYGHRSILIDLGLVGLFGAYTALATKGVSSMLSSTLLGAFTTPVTYALLFVLLGTAVMQVRYVNKALQRFDSTQVIPIQFVIFTLSVIIGSAVLYRDFEKTTGDQAVTFVGGCLLTFFGVFLITSGRAPHNEDEEGLSDVEGIEETIGLHEQDPVGSSGGQRPNTTASTGDDTPSRRSSRVSFMDAAVKPAAVLLDSGIPSLRMPPSSRSPMGVNDTVDIAAEDAPLLGGSPWVASPVAHTALGIVDPSIDGGVGRQRRTFSTESVDDAFQPDGGGRAVMSAPTSTLPTPHGNSDPFDMCLPIFMPSTGTSYPDTPATPRPPTARPQSHHFSGPIISPSPLSSTVSAVVADTLLLRSVESPSSTRRLGVRRSRPGLRSSLFMPHDEALSPVRSDVTSWTASDGGARLEGGVAVEDGGGPSAAENQDDEDTANQGGFRGRARSLSVTLGELFGSRTPRRRRDSEPDDDQAGLLAPAPGPGSTREL